MANLLRGQTVQTRVLIVLSLMAAVVVAFPSILQAIVTETPRRDTPIVLDGQVWAVEQVGNNVVVGGNFTQVQTSRGGPIVNQRGIFAYDINSGQFIEGFRPTLGSQSGTVDVRDIVPAPDGNRFYIGGRFTTVNDGSDGVTRSRNRIAMLDVRNGRVDRNFAQAGVDAAVLSLDLSANGQLYAGGNFINAFDLAPGRPPIIQQVRGLARFDATTGQFDPSFRYETQEDIGAVADITTGRPSNVFNGNFQHAFGVSRVQLNPQENLLVVTHRGAQLVDTTRNQSFDAAGIGVIALNPGGGHNVTGFRALHPDPNDPIQPMYHALQCGGRGAQIRDLDVQNGWLVVVHQGADTGQQCDSIVRYPLTTTPVRPDWVARAFDSVFSVEVDGNDIYVGGHFRYLPHPSAPSPYPGIRLPQGTSTNDIYTADPTLGTERSNLFRDDLVTPGYVFPVGQFGALNATTGYGNPNFDPGSNAQVGVLELTAIDRGLLIGQDRERINGVNTGRSAFLDDNPNAGNPRCSVRLNNTGNPVVSWSNIGNVNQWNIAANGRFVDSVSGTVTQFTDTTQPFGTTVTYELRYNQNGVSNVAACGSVTTGSASLDCSAVIRNGQAEISWNDLGWSFISVLRDGRWVTTLDAGNTTFREPARVNDTAYSIRAFRGGSRTDADCGSVGTGAPTLNCSATVSGGESVVNWNDGGWSFISVLRNGSWVTTLDAGNTTFREPAPTGDTSYSIRAFLGGARTDADCGTVTGAGPNPASLNCTTSVSGNEVTVSWTDGGFSSVSVRRNDRFVTSVTGGQTTFTETIPGGSATYDIRAFVNGTRTDASCGTAAGNGPAAATCQLAGNVLTWSNANVSQYQVRTNDRWVATVPGGQTSYTLANTAGTHEIRYRVGGAVTDIACTG